MFEQFARETRETVRRAVEVAEGEDAAVVEAEHLLIALVDPPRDPVGRALAQAGFTADSIRSARDAEFRSALAAVGVHTTRPMPPASARLRRGRSTRFAPSAKLVLERTVKHATDSRTRRITNRDLLRAVVSAEVGRIPQLLAELGTTPTDLLQRAGGSQAA